jgi:hypothetical protein
MPGLSIRVVGRLGVCQGGRLRVLYGYMKMSHSEQEDLISPGLRLK